MAIGQRTPVDAAKCRVSDEHHNNVSGGEGSLEINQRYVGVTRKLWRQSRKVGLNDQDVGLFSRKSLSDAQCRTLSQVIDIGLVG